MLKWVSGWVRNFEKTLKKAMEYCDVAAVALKMTMTYLMGQMTSRNILGKKSAQKRIADLYVTAVPEMAWETMYFADKDSMNMSHVYKRNLKVKSKKGPFYD